MPKSRHAPLIFAALLGCLAVALVFALLGFYTRPFVDDFCYIEIHARTNLWDVIIDERNAHNNGSYSTLILPSLLRPFGFAIVQLFPAMLVVAQVLGAAALCCIKLMRMAGVVGFSRLMSLALAGLLCGAIFSSLPVRQSLYWYAASLKYTSPVLGSTLFLLLLLRAVESPGDKTRRRTQTALGGLLCFFVAGFAETFTIPMLMGLLLLLGWAWLAGGKWKQRCAPILTAGCVATAASMLVMVTAPAVATRATVIADKDIVSQRGWLEYLGQVADSWLHHLSHPAALAAFALTLAAGLLVGFMLPAREPRPLARSTRLAWLPALAALLVQLALVPLIWSHQSDNALILGRFSIGYFSVVSINAALIVGLSALLVIWRRDSRTLSFTGRALPCAMLAFMLLCVALTRGRAMHWRAYASLWLTFHSLLPVLCLGMLAQMERRQARILAAAIGSLYPLIMLGTAAVSFATVLHKPNDAWRVYTYLPYLTACLGMVCGICISHGGRGALGMDWRFKLAALLVAVWLGGAIIVDNLQLLPKYQTYAQIYDGWHETILEGKEQGQRQFTFTLPDYDLPHEMRVWRSLLHRCRLAYYDIDAPTLLNNHWERRD